MTFKRTIILFMFAAASCTTVEKEFETPPNDPEANILPLQDNPQRSSRGVRLPEEYPSREECEQFMGPLRAQCEVQPGGIPPVSDGAMDAPPTVAR